MAKNRSDKTIKTLIFILVFLIIILILLMVLIIPNIKSYKLNKSDLKIFSEKNNYLSKKQVELKRDIENLKNSNKNIIHILDKDFNEKKFLLFASNYLKDVNLTKNDKVTESSFETYKFFARTSSKSPKDFFKFIDNLKTYESLVKINFPISLTSKSDRIELNFNVAVYKKQ